jgi:hypothetical protein
MDRKKLIIIILILFTVVSVVTIIVILLKRSGSSKSNKNGVKYAWQSAPDPGSTCSVTCGGGTRYLNVWCEAVDSTGKDVKQVDDSLCDQSSKPSGTQPCNTQPCVWDVGNWSVCLDSGGNPQTCGYNGTQTRTVTCTTGGCSDSNKPPTTQNCPNTNCDWTYTDWAPQDCAVCGQGTQTRTEKCSVPPDSNCGPLGVLSQPCTSANSCAWESQWIPFPPSTLNLSNFNQKSVKLANANNQNFGLTYPVGGGALSITDINSASVLSTVTYVSQTNVLGYVAVSNPILLLGINNTNNQVGIWPTSQMDTTLLGLITVGNTIMPILYNLGPAPIGSPGYFDTDSQGILYFSITAPTSNPITIIPILSS